MSKSFHVAVGSYEGPFDLLLQLIARHKLDVSDIAIADITDEYLAILRAMDQLDLEVTTEFLVVAATLVELKAARLLPDEDEPELDELALESRDLLYARLLEYRTFKEASAWLGGRLDAHIGYVARHVGPEPRFRGLVPPFDLSVDADGLAAIAARALADTSGPGVDFSHLQPVRITVREATAMVLHELSRAGGRASFAELTARCRHRVEAIVCFLALLELYKLDRVELQQAGCFGEIEVEWIASHAVSQAAALTAAHGMDPDEYTGGQQAGELAAEAVAR